MQRRQQFQKLNTHYKYKNLHEQSCCFAFYLQSVLYYITDFEMQIVSKKNIIMHYVSYFS